MKLGKIEKNILTDLYKSEKGLLDYTLHIRYGYSVSKILKLIEKFSHNELVSYDGLRIKITNKGREYLLSNRLIRKGQKDIFSKIPEDFVDKRLEINEFYVPDKSSMDFEE